MLPDHRVIAVHPLLSSSLRFLGANYFRFTVVVVVVSFISPFAVAVAVTVRSLFFGSFLRKDFSHGAEKEEP